MTVRSALAVLALAAIIALPVLLTVSAPARAATGTSGGSHDTTAPAVPDNDAGPPADAGPAQVDAGPDGGAPVARDQEDDDELFGCASAGSGAGWVVPLLAGAVLLRGRRRRTR